MFTLHCLDGHSTLAAEKSNDVHYKRISIQKKGYFSSILLEHKDRHGYKVISYVLSKEETEKLINQLKKLL